MVRESVSVRVTRDQRTIGLLGASPGRGLAQEGRERKGQMKPKAVERGQWYRLTVRLTIDENATLERVSAQLDQSPNTLLRAVIAHLVPRLGEVDVLIDAAQRAPVDEILDAMAHVLEQRATYYHSLHERHVPNGPATISAAKSRKTKQSLPDTTYQATLFGDADG